MISEHVYTASVSGVALDVKGGELRLDAGRAPYVQGTLKCSLPGVWQTTPGVGSLNFVAGSDVLDALDPRTSPAPRVIVTATEGATSRAFDLHVRDRVVDVEEGTVTVTLASDEGLLQDYAPLIDDYNPVWYLARSIRSIVNYVLDQSIDDVTPILEAAPSVDADVTPYWSVTNLQRNPAVRTDVSNWSPGGGCTLSWQSQGSSGVVRASMTGVGGAVFAVNTAKYDVNAQPGKDYTFSVLARCEVPYRSGEQVAAVLRFLDANNGTIRSVSGTATQMQSGEYRTLTISARAPANAVKLAPYVAITGSASGRVIVLDAAMLYEGDPLLPVASFTGADDADGGYTYAFQGPANDSPSVRTPVVERDPEALIWRAGMSALDYLHPLLQANGLRLVCDEQRRWTLREATYQEPGTLTLRERVNIIGAEETISRDSGLWFDARVTRYRWTDRDGIQQERSDAFALTPHYSRLTRVDVPAAYPGPGRSEYAVRLAQGVGREVTAQTVADWATVTEQAVQAGLDHAPALIGVVQSVTFNLDDDTMIVTTRTRDIPAGAVDLLTGTINALTGTVNAL